MDSPQSFLDVELGSSKRSPFSLFICGTVDMSLELLVATVAGLWRQLELERMSQTQQGNLGFAIVFTLPPP